MSQITSNTLESYRIGSFVQDSFPFIDFLHCFLGVFCSFYKIALIWIFRIWYFILFCVYLSFLILYRNVFVLQTELWITPFKWHMSEPTSIFIAREMKQTMWHIQIDAILQKRQNTSNKQYKKSIKGKLSWRNLPIL